MLYTDIPRSAPLLPNILPHFQTLLNFVTNTLPKPVLVALLYRLTVLHMASRILPTIGADSWESEDGVDDGWDGRPVRAHSLLPLLVDFSSDDSIWHTDFNSKPYPPDIQAIHLRDRIFTLVTCVILLSFQVLPIRIYLLFRQY